MMAHCVHNYGNRTMHSDRYEENCLEDEDADEDEDDFDDEDVDFYDGLSDYGDEDPVHSRSYNRHGLSNTLDDRVTSSGSDPRRQRSISESSLGLLESGEDNRRDHHNQLERKRRASIKTSYNDLREVIPSLSGSKASRAVILQRAVEYIEDLVKMNWEHTVCVEKLRRQNDILDSQVQGMQRTMQRLDGEEAALCITTNCGSTGPTQNPIASYRLTPTNGNSNSTTSNNPVYRLLPQDGISSERHSGSNSTLPQTTNASGTRGPSTSTTVVIPNRNRTSPVLHFDNSSTTLSGSGQSTISPVNSLVGSTNSVFSSSVSSSTGSNGVLVQSSSQRSSPNDLSSMSSSSTSSSNPASERSTTLDDYPPPNNRITIAATPPTTTIITPTIPLVVDPIPIHSTTTLIKPQTRCVRAPSPIQLVGGSHVILNHLPIRSRSTTSESDSSNSQTKEIHIRNYDLACGTNAGTSTSTTTSSSSTTLPSLSERPKRRKLN